jgi:hypothetical protein
MTGAKNENLPIIREPSALDATSVKYPEIHRIREQHSRLREWAVNDN